jgi:hypothetical protein
MQHTTFRTDETYRTYTHEICMYSHYIIYNVSIYFCKSIYNTCNIPTKKLKHLKHTLATCGFHPFSFVRHNTEQATADSGKLAA